MKRDHIKLLLLVTGSFILSGCSMGDIYNSNSQKEAEETNFVNRFGEIASNQTWNTVAQRKASINLNGSSSETYTINICSSNPAIDSTAQTLYQTTATGGQTISATFDAPAPLRQVFVSRVGTDGQYYACAKMSADSTTFIGSFAPATVSSAKAKTRSSAVVSGDPFTFENTDQYYPSSIPSNAVNGNNLDYNGWMNNKIIYCTTGTITPNYWNSESDPRNIYVNGTINLNVNSAMRAFNVYIMSGSTVNLTGTGEFYGFISVAKGATLNITRSTISDNKSVKIYNRGTVTLVKDTYFNNNVSIYNEGLIDSKDQSISFSAGSGNPTFFYNIGGTVNLDGLYLSSICHMYNSGTVNVSGPTKINKDGIWWINNGHYTTTSFLMSAKNCTFYNYCQLIINGSADFYDGTFNNMDEAYIQCKNLYLSNFLVNMGSRSAFYVRTKTMAYTPADGEEQGFKGVGNYYAFVKLGGTTSVSKKVHYDVLQFLGNLYYSIRLVDDWTWIWQNYVLYADDNSQGINYNNAYINDPTDDTCCPTWKVTTNDPVYPTVATNTIAYEDLGATDDFDFNDIVLYVYPDYTTMKMKVDLVAAGGILPIDVYFDNTLLFSKKDGKMTNTTTKGSVIDSKEGIDLPTGFTMSDSKYTSLFKIKVNSTSSTNVINPNISAGSAPQALVIGGAWDWPTERTHIDDAYPSFNSYVSNPTVNWTNSKKAGKYVQ